MMFASSAWKTGVLAVLSGLVVSAARGQEPGAAKTSWESDFRFAYVGGSEFKDRADIGSVDAINWGTRDVLSVQARDGLLVRFGFELERATFGIPNATKLPKSLQAASLVIGADLQLGEAWIVRVEVQPGFYSNRTSLRTQDLNMPVTIGASYFVSADLQLVAGVSVDLNRKYPVLPGAGFRWKFAADWVLDAILPTPRLEYNFSKSLLLYGGGDLQGGTYRVDGNFGNSHGDVKLNDAVVDYTQIRVGGGASWKVNPDVTFELEAGAVPVHEFDFHRADERARSTGVPPYAGVALKASF
jgi:hypothetical protein